MLIDMVLIHMPQPLRVPNIVQMSALIVQLWSAGVTSNELEDSDGCSSSSATVALGEMALDELAPAIC